MARTIPPMDFPPLDDYDEGWGFLDGPLLDPEFVREAPLVAGGGAIATVAYGLLTAYAKVTPKDATADTPKVSWFDKDWKRLLGAATVGLVGGRLAWGQQRDLARGMLGAMGGQIAIDLVKMITGKKNADGTPVLGADGKQSNLFSGGALGEDYYLSDGDDADSDSAMSQLAQAEPEDRNLLSDVNVEESRQLIGLEDTFVETRRPELSWLA